MTLIGTTLFALLLVWALVLGWWQANDHTPSSTEMLLYLGALPLSMIGGYWLLRGFIDHLKAPAEAAAPPRAVADDPLAGAPSTVSSDTHGESVYLLDSFICTPAGDDAAQLLSAVAEGKRPAPDAALSDDDGFPVFAARVDELDVAAVAELDPPPGRSRWLALIVRVLPGVVDRVRECLAARTTAARFHLLWLLPPAVPVAEFSDLRTWLLSQCLDGLAPERIDLVLQSAATEAEVMAHLDGVVVSASQRPDDGDIHGVLAAGTAIDAATVTAWSARGMLFSATSPNGMMPGEGALCLLLSASPDDDTQVRISRVNGAARDKAVDAHGRISGTLLGALATALLPRHQLVPADICAIVSDADHRASRASELFDAFGDDFAALDPAADYPCIGTVCGSLAPFGGLLAVAAASASVTDRPALCITQQHPTARAAVLLFPLPPPADCPAEAS
ncbi:MAG: hypothetical protein DWQ11_02025 [Proteobacteria bacterium]|nr:MAG: hypothetical protein DWQ11_02025 [Pseudomonadota bacterium]